MILEFIKMLFKQRILLFIIGLGIGFVGAMAFYGVNINYGTRNIINMGSDNIKIDVKKFPTVPHWHGLEFDHVEITDPRPGYLVTKKLFKMYLEDIKNGNIVWNYPHSDLQPSVGDFVRYHVKLGHYVAIPAQTYIDGYRKLQAIE